MEKRCVTISCVRRTAVLLLLGLVWPCQGALQVPDEQVRTNAAQMSAAIQRMSVTSLSEKIEVGKLRYDQRQAFRNAIAAGMKSNLEQHESQLAGSPDASPANVGGTDPSDTTPNYVLLAALPVVAFCGYRCYRRWFPQGAPGY